jgi:hypothetical protein
MSRRTLLGILLLLLVIAALIGILVPAILKVKYGAHVVQQMASFREVCLYVADHNKPPRELSIQGIKYEPNALGHGDKILFYRKCFSHEIVTFGNGHFKLLNGRGEIESEGDVFGGEEYETIFREYTGSEPYSHRYKYQANQRVD